MLILHIFIIVFILNYAFAQNNKLYSIDNDNSEECVIDNGEFENCLKVLGLTEEDYINQIDKNNDSFFSNSQCATFMENSFTRLDHCTLDNNSTSDRNLILFHSILKLKLKDVTYHAKDFFGNLCPISDYLTSHLNKNYTESSNDLEIVLGNDCKDKECNRRILLFEELEQKIENISSILKNTYDDGGDSFSLVLPTDVQAIYELYLNHYKNNRCGDIEEYATDEITYTLKPSLLLFTCIFFFFFFFSIYAII